MEILITEPTDFSENALDRLSVIGNIKKGPFCRKELFNAITHTDVLIVRLGHLIDHQLIEKAIQLKYILSPTTGLNHIDIEFANKKNIRIISLKGEDEFLDTIPSTAEHTWALLMALLRKVPQSFADVKKGNWDRDKFKGNNLEALSIGVFGFGRVGKQVAKIAKFFKMQVFVYDINEIESADCLVVNSPSELFQNSDIITVHLDLKDENKSIIDKELLSQLKKGAYLINTSRGELINEVDLVMFLENKTLIGVAVDVIQNENLLSSIFDSPIINFARKNDNVIVTPHIAGATFQSMLMTEEFVVNKFIDIFKNKK